MPIDSLVLSIAVCAMFLTFAAALAWADWNTTRWQRKRALVEQVAIPIERHREAA